jgi:LysM repeat protein
MPPIVTAAIATAAGAPLLLGAGVGSWTNYTVRDGDTVWDIASRHSTDVRTLIRANHLSDGGHLIRAGATLRVPGRVAATHKAATRARTARYVVRPGDTISHLALRLKVSPATILRLNHLDSRGRIYAGQHLTVPAAAVKAQARAAAARAAAARYTTYTVRSGDTVSAIAARVGATQAAVLKANRLRVASVIHPGQKLRVPRKASTSAAYDHNTFAGRTYPAATVRAAAANRSRLANRAVPGRDATRRLIVRTAQRYGVDPALALAVGYQESGWNQRQVSVANAIGTMQVIPSSGRWASDLVGRRLNLLDARDNVTAGVVILKALTTSAADRDQAIAGYYQGLASVRQRGMHADTKQYVRNIVRLSQRFR